MKLKFLLVGLIATQYLQATNITSLLNTLEKRPEHRLDSLNAKKVPWVNRALMTN